jgi:hypothetical protein
LPIPDSPFAAGTAPEPEPKPAPPKPELVESAAAAEVFEVPPLVEPVVEPKPVPHDPAAQIMSEIAAIVAKAPRAIPAVAVDLAALLAVDPPAAPQHAPMPQPAPAATPRPPAPPRARPDSARRVPIRRARPRVARPARKNAAASPARPKTVPTKLADRLGRVGGAASPQRPRPVAARPSSPQASVAAAPAPQARPAAPSSPAPAAPPPPPAARAPARDRPVMAPAAANVARVPRTALAPAAVPETRPLTQNRRLYRRVMLSAELEIAGTPCRLIDLSIGGFAAQGAARLDSGALVPVTLRMTIDGINIGTEFQARIVYGNGARAAGRFVELTAAQTAFLRYIVTWRGEAIGAVGTTTLLDAITRWPERAFQPHPSTVKPPAERQGFWSRLFGRIPLLGWRRRD